MKHNIGWGAALAGYVLLLFAVPLQAEITSADAAAIEAEVKAQFDSIPQYGYAEITAIRDSSEYPADLVFDKGLHDETPRDSVIAIKHLATGKYLAARKTTIAGKDLFVLKPDADSSADKAAQFDVKRHLSTVPKLRDYWGISSSVANDFSLQATDDGTVGFISQAFNDETSDRSTHWTLQGAKLGEVYLENRPSSNNAGGIAMYENEDRVVKTGEQVNVYTETATWGLAQAGSAVPTRAGMSAKNDIVKYGDCVRIRTDYNDFVMRWGSNISRTDWHKGVGERTAKNVFWRIEGGTVGTALKIGDSFKLVSLAGDWSEDHRVFVDEHWRDKIGEPVAYGQQVAFIASNGAWMQTYGRSKDGMGWGQDWDLPGCWLKLEACSDAHYQYQSMAGYGALARQADGSWQLMGDKKFISLAVKTDNQAWGLDPSGGVWEWDGAVWRAIPSSVAFINIGVNAKKVLYCIDKQGVMFERTSTGWTKKKAIANRVELKSEDWKLVKGSADVYSSDCPTQALPAQGDYVLSFKVIASDEIRVKIANYDVYLWSDNGVNSGVMKDGVQLNITSGSDRVAFSNDVELGIKSDVAQLPYALNRTLPMDVNIVVRASSKELIVYVNGCRKFNAKDDNMSLTPNVAKFGASSASVQYGAITVTNCPPPEQIDAYMATRNDAGSLAVAASDTIWCIAADGGLVKYDGGEKALPQTLLGKNVSGVSCADDGTTWAVCNNQDVWQLNTIKNAWELRDPPAEKPFIVDLAVRSANEIYLLSAEGVAFLWDGKTWTRQAAFPGLRKLSVGSGVTKTVTPIMSNVHFDQMMTHDKDGNIYKVADAGKLAIEVLKLGFGGNIASQETVCCTLPAMQNPEVSGFAKTNVTLQPGATLAVQPLDSRGGAWPKKTFEKPNRATVSFLAKPSPQGDVQLLLGDTISTSYLFKIKIGTAGNTRACIIRRTLVDNKEVDEEVFGIDKKQNGLAYVPPGNFTPYWVTYDNGLILVGMGQPGDHVFMAYRCDDPPDLVNHVGFATKDGAVEYAEMQYLPPVVTEEIARIYKTLPGSITLSANGAASAGSDSGDASSSTSPKGINVTSVGPISWQDIPFRVVGGGAVGFEITGEQQCFIALGEGRDASKPHYLITFGEGKNEGLSIKKSTDSGGYRLLVMQTNKGFKGLNLDPSKPVKAWVSYDKGLIIVGNGPLGENPVLAYNDFVYLPNVSQVGFGASGSSACTVNNVSLTGPINLELENPESLYSQVTAYVPSVSGPLDIILPFWYRIRQEEEKLVLYDKITNQSFFVAGMPQQGTLYSFLATIKEDGFLSMATAKEPDSPIQMAIKRDVVSMQANADLERQKAAIVAQLGQLDAGAVAGEAAIKRAQAEGVMKDAETTSAAANGLAGGLAMGAAGTNAIFFATAIAAGVTGSEIAKSLNAKAADLMVDAAKIDEQAARVADAAKREAIKNQEKALKLEQKANLLAGNAKFAFKGVNSYVYVDAPKRPELGEAVLSADVVGARNYVTEEMNSLGQVPVNSPEAFDSIIVGLQDIVYRTTNCFVVTDIVKKKFVDKVYDLTQAYPEIFGQELNARIINKLINLLLTSINNSYLVNPTQDAETRETFYAWMNKQAQGLIEAQLGIDLKPCYGEYVWLPVSLDDSPDDFSLSFEASGQNDLFVAFAHEPARIRNTNTEIYEIKINNTATVLSLESLGQPITLLTKADYPKGAIISPYTPQKYTISLKNGVVSVQVGDSKAFTWTDNYPDKGMRWIGVSNWDKPVSITKLSITPGKTAPEPEVAASAVSVDEQYPVDELPPVQDKQVAIPVPSAPASQAKKQPTTAKKQKQKVASVTVPTVGTKGTHVAVK